MEPRSSDSSSGVRNRTGGVNQEKSVFFIGLRKVSRKRKETQLEICIFHANRARAPDRDVVISLVLERTGGANRVSEPGQIVVISLVLDRFTKNRAKSFGNVYIPSEPG